MTLLRKHKKRLRVILKHNTFMPKQTIHGRLEMAEFSEKSFAKLRTCDIRLVKLFAEVVKEFDCTVLEGARNAIIQMGDYHSVPRKTNC